MTFDDDKPIEEQLDEAREESRAKSVLEAADKVASAIRESKVEIDFERILKPFRDLKPQDLSPLLREIKSGYDLMVEALKKKESQSSTIEPVIKMLIDELRFQSQERKRLIDVIDQMKSTDYSDGIKSISEALKKSDEEWLFQINKNRTSGDWESVKAIKIK